MPTLLVVYQSLQHQFVLLLLQLALLQFPGPVTGLDLYREFRVDFLLQTHRAENDQRNLTKKIMTHWSNTCQSNVGSALCHVFSEHDECLQLDGLKYWYLSPPSGSCH